MKTCAADEAQALIEEIAELLVADFGYSRLTKRKGGNSAGRLTRAAQPLGRLSRLHHQPCNSVGYREQAMAQLSTSRRQTCAESAYAS
jgi:hypothetical protein